MRKEELKKRVLALGLTIGLVASLAAGCGNNSEEAESTSEDGVKTITVASGNTYAPYCYLDDDGNAVGYEYDVLAAIDEKLDQYEFQYENMNFDNLLLSLDEGKVDLVAHQFEKTEEREAKYLYADEYYTSFTLCITVAADNDSVETLDDLQGKKVWGGGTTSAAYQILQAYNEEHKDNPIEIISNEDNSTEYQVTSLLEGAFEASLNADRDIDLYNEEYTNGGDPVIKTVGEPLNTSMTYYLYRLHDDEETELKEAVDAALAELRADGTLKELSEKWLGGDYTESPEE